MNETRRQIGIIQSPTRLPVWIVIAEVALLAIGAAIAVAITNANQ